MSHEIKSHDKVGYSYKPAWHGLGKVFDRMMKTADVLRDTTVGAYQVLQTPGLVAFDPKTGRVWQPAADSSEVPPGFKFIRTDGLFNVRSDLKMPNRAALLSSIGVRKGYEVVQNEELCEICDRVVGETGASYESAGTLRNGRLVWLLARYPEDISIEGDAVRRYILMFSAHDGSRPITVAVTPTRVVCWNTLSAALAERGNQVTIRHTSSAKERIETAVRAAREASAGFNAFTTLFNSMARRAIDDRFTEAYLKALYPDPKGEGRKAGKAETKRDQIKKLLNGDQANATGPGMRLNGKPTEYALWNAVAEYWQYRSISRVSDGRDENEEHLYQNAMGGTQFGQRSRALELLTRSGDLVVAAATRN